MVLGVSRFYIEIAAGLRRAEGFNLRLLDSSPRLFFSYREFPKIGGPIIIIRAPLQGGYKSTIRVPLKDSIRV